MVVVQETRLNPGFVRYFFTRGDQTRTLEIRVDPGATSFEILVVDGDREHLEQFGSLDDLMTRERVIFNEWGSDGWHLDMPPKNHIH
jgi:hypothetical protein